MPKVKTPTVSVTTSAPIPPSEAVVRRIALVAHDHKKADLLDWATFNQGTLAQHALYATGTTGKLLQDALGLQVTCLQSGPLGGDQQIGALIVEQKVDCLIFFWDPLAPLPHDPDIKALLRLAVVWNIPMACNRATADYVIASPLFRDDYARRIPSYGAYLARDVSKI